MQPENTQIEIYKTETVYIPVRFVEWQVAA